MGRTCGMPYADLHIHSTFSDGVRTPRQILEQARSSGLLHIAITDHDVLDGSRLASDLGSSYGVEVIPGVEITTQTDDRTVHLLGYFIDPDDEGLAQFFATARKKREDRTCAMAVRLADDGYPVSPERLRESGQAINRPLLGRMLVECGAASSVDDAFKRFLGSSSKYYVDYRSADTVEAIHLVDEAGGFAFIAHPALYHVVDLIAQFQREGLAGLEAYHSLQSEEDSALLVARAEELGLAMSGGSDWHGDGSHHASLGSAGLDRASFTQFLHACGR